jgi:uncharacterized protein
MNVGEVNILIARNVKPERHADFEQVVRDWVAKATQFPGHLGVLMIRPGEHSDEYGAVLRFTNESRWNAFKDWPDYQRFLDQIRPMLSTSPVVKPLHGLEAWFTPADHAPPKWRMAILTFLGVCIMVYLFSTLIGHFLPTAPWIVKFLLGNALVVASLTWVTMPILVKLFHRWVHPHAH